MPDTMCSSALDQETAAARERGSKPHWPDNVFCKTVALNWGEGGGAILTPSPPLPNHWIFANAQGHFGLSLLASGVTGQGDAKLARTAPVMKNYLAPNVSSAEGEKA